MRNDFRRTRQEETLERKMYILRELCGLFLSEYYRDPMLRQVQIFYYLSCSESEDITRFGMQLFLINHFSRGYCMSNLSRKVFFRFGNLKTDEFEAMKQKAAFLLSSCSMLYTCKKCRVLDLIQYEKGNFNRLIQDEEVKKIFCNPHEGKLVLLEQLSFSEEDKPLFDTLVDSPKTDFILFVNSVTIDRFKKSEWAKKIQIKSSLSDFELVQAYHKEIARYCKSLIPASKEYFFHLFSRQQGSNMYGIILGTASLANMSKFLNICWKQDPFFGESNFIKPSFSDDRSMIDSSGLSHKQQKIKKEFVELVLQGRIDNQRACAEFAISRGFVFSFFAKVIEELVEQEKVKIVGVFTAKTINRHDVNNFLIKIL